MAAAALAAPRDERHIAAWNAEIKSFAQRGQSDRALALFIAMRASCFRVYPDNHTFPPLLAAVTARHHCRPMHAHVIKSGLQSDRFCAASLIAMYARAGMLPDAKLAFDTSGCAAAEDVVVWSSLISAFLRCGAEHDAVRAFIGMLLAGVRPSRFVYSNMFAACGRLTMLEMGRQLHCHSLKNAAVDADAPMSNALLTMYSECGCVDDAWRVFHSNGDGNNVVSFNAMIAALAQHGHAKSAVKLFREMTKRRPSLQPDDVSVLNLLTAFNHAGLVVQGLQLFDRMETEIGVKPTYQHYACVVDMLARAGELARAVEVINNMPFEAETPLWRVVLGACRTHKDIVIGRQVAAMLLEKEADEPANYTMLANIYSRTRRYDEAAHIRELMMARGVEKEDSFSWVEVGGETHTFAVEDRAHPRSPEIYENLHRLIGDIRKAGYVPDGSFAAAVDGGEEGRVESLKYHCEKLAFAFLDMVSAPGRAVRVMKNRRVCGDCHSAFKYLSTVTRRRIVLKDNHRFHHFSQGSCSCGDFW